MVTRNPNPVVK